MREDSDVSSYKEQFLKSRLEVRLNDLEKRHLETKEREAQAVGFLERRLRQVELEHKMELKLRRQLRYEVNNLRKRLLETYKLYSDALEQNEVIKKELDTLKEAGSGKVRVGHGKLNISMEVSVVIHDRDCDFGECFAAPQNEGSENDRGIQRNRMSFVTPSNSGRANAFFTPLSSMIGNEKTYPSINGRGCKDNSFARGGSVHGSGFSGAKGENSGYGQRDSLVKSERAQDWLRNVEELYRPFENKKTSERVHKERKRNDKLLSLLRVEDSLDMLEDLSFEEIHFPGEDVIEESFDNLIAGTTNRNGAILGEGKFMTDNAEIMATNTELIIDQINQQDRELSSLLKKASICGGVGIGNAAESKRRVSEKHRERRNRGFPGQRGR